MNTESPAFQRGLSAGVYVAGLVVAGLLVGTRPLAGLAQLVVESTPGVVATVSIELLGKAAQPALVAGIAAAVVAGAVAAGRVADRLPSDSRLGIGLLVAATLASFGLAGATPVGVVAGTGIAVGPTVAARAAVAAGADGDRRSFLRRTGVAGLAVTGVGAGAATVGRVGRETDGVQPGQSIDEVDEEPTAATAVRTKTEGTTTPTVTPGATEAEASMLDDSADADVQVGERETDEPFGFDFDGMPAELTPVADHYVVDKQLDNPDLAADDWTLTVGVGDATDEKTELGLTDLVGHPDRRKRVVTMACISNPVGGPLISTTRWRGVPAIDLLESVGLADDATDVITQAADGYEEAIPLEVVERGDVLVAYGMNGQTLPREHGFPARLLIPGRYGMKMTKWLTGLGASSENRIGYWTNRGWTEEAVVKTSSAIRAAQRRGDRIALGGIAFAGRRGIDRVEVSLDGGDTWHDAELEPPLADDARRRWRYVTEREPGRVRAVVRATDGTGETQTRERAPPHPNGASGWHRAAFDL